MDKEIFIKTLHKGINKLENRNLLVNSCIKNPSYIATLLDNMNSVDDKNSTFSARIFELTCKRDLKIIIPHLDFFCKLINKVNLEGSIRPCAKICELLMLKYFTKTNIFYSNMILEKHLEKIIEAGFDWMIGHQKTAVKAYTMQTLYLLGTKYNWIHTELALIIEKDIPTGTTGYVNRGRKVLKAIETKSRLKL